MEMQMELSKPMITEIVGGYEFGYIEGLEEGIVIQVRDIHRDRTKNLVAELDIGGVRLDMPTALLANRLNLNSLSTRKKFAKDLAERIGTNSIPFDNIIEDVSRRIILLYRDGRPTEEVWTSDEITPPGYLLEPILPLNLPTIIFGDGGSGKSHLATLIALLVQLPWHDNPLGLKPRNESIKVLYHDYETSKEQFQWVLSSLAKGAGLGAVSITYLRADTPLADNIGAVERIVRKGDYKLYIADSLAQATGGNINEPEPALRYFAALRKLNITTLSLAHTSKDQFTKTKSTFGSVFFTNYARCVWECKKTQEEGADEMVVGLFHRKANISRKHLPLGLKLVFSDDMVKVSREDLQDTDLISSMSVRFQIKETLSKGALSPEEIAEAIDKPVGTVRTTLYRSPKTFVNLGKGKSWGILQGEKGEC